MIKQIILVCAFALMMTAMAQGQEGRESKIDKDYQACLDKNQTTAGMVECADKAYRAWDKEMNAVYNKLMANFVGEDRQTLKATQFEWLKFRDAEFKMLEQFFSKIQGSMYRPIAVDRRVEIVKQRAQQLQAYLDTVQEQ